ncbi:hypothetical protein XA68_16727 [Ophiocordyceps unilateralis]|uniref:Uncharacterized protein n=1 Tax=Ophiocordyceps unilateralis TaxID=268505 RepID=A0A2A9P611_OPHUN|nr:hypothetical protein XA68_16727 [Ophiocordyceps unilateralis]
MRGRKAASPRVLSSATRPSLSPHDLRISSRCSARASTLLSGPMSLGARYGNPSSMSQGKEPDLDRRAALGKAP